MTSQNSSTTNVCQKHGQIKKQLIEWAQWFPTAYGFLNDHINHTTHANTGNIKIVTEIDVVILYSVRSLNGQTLGKPTKT